MLYRIRKAQAKDVAPVYRFICLLEETDFPFIGFKSIFEANIKNIDYHYMVADKGNDTIVGFISCHTQKLLHHGGRVAEIQELYVDERHRKAGIGKRLIDALEKKLQDSACIYFEVTAQNKRTATHLFYENAGFKNSHKKFVKALS